MYMIYVVSYAGCARLWNSLCSNFLELGWVLCPTKQQQKKTSFTIASRFKEWIWFCFYFNLLAWFCYLTLLLAYEEQKANTGGCAVLTKKRY